MKWVLLHDAKARWIAEQGTLWMEDLVFHPDAPQDEPSCRCWPSVHGEIMFLVAAQTVSEGDDLVYSDYDESCD
jgi:hypothetical protein